MNQPAKTISTRAVVLGGLLVALVLAGVISFYASNSPDGLERVSHDKGFSQAATGHHASDSPMADYSTKGISQPRLSNGVAGVTGTLIVLGLAGGGFWILRRRTSHSEHS